MKKTIPTNIITKLLKTGTKRKISKQPEEKKYTLYTKEQTKKIVHFSLGMVVMVVEEAT